MLVLPSLIFGILICFVAFYATFRWKRRRLYELAAKIPGPDGLPFIGIGHKFLIPGYQKKIKFHRNSGKKFSSLTKLWLGPELLIVVNTPEALQIVLNSQHCLNKSKLYDVVPVNKGLVVANGQLWRHHRKILNPAFTPRAIQQLIPIFDLKANILAENLRAQVGEKPFDVTAYVAACSLETILKGTMEIDRNIQGNPLNNEYIENFEMGSRVIMTKMVNVFYRFKPYYWCSKLYKLEKKYVTDGCLKMADEVMEERLKKQSFENQSPRDDDDEDLEKPKNFINTLTDPRFGLSKEEIWHEINTLIGAAHETSALVVSHTLLMLGIHQEVQQKASQELKEIYSSKEVEVTYDSLSKLTYLDMVIKETMRLFPVLPLSARETTGEFDIGFYKIPVGATILISSFQVQRSTKYWGDDAHQFRPERFEPESFKKIHPYAYIPFTGGPRICIGWRYGMMFMKAILVNVLRNYEIGSKLSFEELEYEFTVSMKIVQKAMITLQARDENN